MPIEPIAQKSEIARKRKLAEMLLGRATDDNVKATGLAGGINALTKALSGWGAGHFENKASEMEGDRTAAIAKLIKDSSVPEDLMRAGIQYEAPELTEFGQWRQQQGNRTADMEWRQSQAAQEQSNFEAKMAQDAAQHAATLAAKEGADWRPTPDGTGWYQANSSGPPQVVRDPSAQKPPSPNEVKLRRDTELEVADLDSTIAAFDEAEKLAPKVMSGYGTGVAAWVGEKMPGGNYIIDRDAAIATRRYQDIVEKEAINALQKLKGATTDFELQKHLDIIADPAADPTRKQASLTRLKELAIAKRDIQRGVLGGMKGQEAPAAGGGAPAKRFRYDAQGNLVAQ